MDGNEVDFNNCRVVRRNSVVKNHRKIAADHLNYLKLWEQILSTQKNVLVTENDGNLESCSRKREGNNEIKREESKGGKNERKQHRKSTKPRIVGVLYKFPCQYERDILDIVIGRSRWNDS
ncbi:uncharacterized protein LOC123317331 isoform X2 [Coccinella septempunctata]|uniref:uncharacterized protein LOC123317331 isoform X2 n=1 Tax=Coccinella septempunctata TaxID=41139 RepID=UPI001D06314B|nr:uncharacterized protein LOC123317331 isoform X2 [Coccinella septempunctata]